MCSIDYDRPTMYVATMRRARKEHKCSECHRHISPGETYCHVAAIWEGSPNVHKTCAHCAVGQQLLMEQCGGFLHEGVEDDLVEHLWPDIRWSMDAARIVVGMRRRWRRFDGKGLMKVPRIRFNDQVVS